MLLGRNSGTNNKSKDVQIQVRDLAIAEVNKTLDEFETGSIGSTAGSFAKH